MSRIGLAEYSGTYALSMRDAHRKPPQALRAPSLTRHLAFRRRADAVTEASWIELIELRIIEIFISLRINAGKEDRAASADRSTRISNLRQEAQEGRPIPPSSPSSCSFDELDLMKHRYVCQQGAIRQVGEISVQGSRYDTVIIASIWRNLPLSIRFEAFEEYFTLSLTIELTTSHASSPTDGVWANLTKLLDALDQRFLEGGAVRLQNAKSDESVRDWVQHICSGVWDDFSQDILASAFGEMLPNTSYVDPQIRRRRADSAGDDIVLDFRGLILSLDSPDKAERRIRRPTHIEDASRYVSIPARSALGRTVFTPEVALEWVQRLFPILLDTEPNLSIPPFETAEYTWSTFDHGRVLYGSGFGPQASGDEAGRPLTYVMLFAHDDWRTIGRMVNRLHTMGTLRLAALLDFDRIVYRDGVLLRLDHELALIERTQQEADLPSANYATAQALLQSVNRVLLSALAESEAADAGRRSDVELRSILKSLTTGAQEVVNALNHQLDSNDVALHGFGQIKPESKWPPNDRQAIAEFCRAVLHAKERVQVRLQKPEHGPDRVRNRNRLDWLRRELNSISRLADLLVASVDVDSYIETAAKEISAALDCMDDRFRFGLQYRSGRSRYHRERFNDLAAAMRVGEVPGFQRYDEFVQHRMERSFSLITTVAERFLLVRARAALLDDRMAKKSSARSRSLSDDKMSAIWRSQYFAEAILVGIIAPYYLSSLLKPLGGILDPGGRLDIKALGINIVAFLITVAIYFTWRARKASRRKLPAHIDT